jgi:hypothetical protein
LILLKAIMNAKGRVITNLRAKRQYTQVTVWLSIGQEPVNLRGRTSAIKQDARELWKRRFDDRRWGRTVEVKTFGAPEEP